MATLILLTDKFFDAMNVRSHSEAAKKRKPFCEPYTSGDDDRFQVNLVYHQLNNLSSRCASLNFTSKLIQIS